MSDENAPPAPAPEAPAPEPSAEPAATPAAPAPAAPSGGSFLKTFLAVLGAGCVLLILCAVVLLALVGSCASKIKQKVEEEQRRLSELPVSAVTWADVEEAVGPANKDTHLQKQEAWGEKYKGQKVRWSGTVVTVGQFLGAQGLLVRMSEKPSLREIFASDVLLMLRSGQKEKALGLEKGDPITFEGVLEGQNVKLGKRHVIVSLKAGEISGGAGE